MESTADRNSETTFVHDVRIEDIREAIKGRTDFRECIFEDHTIFVYFLGMGKHHN